MSCFLNFDKCINAVEKMPVRPSVIEKSHKQKIRIDFKFFFSLLHIWEERHQKNDHITAYIYCVILLSLVNCDIHVNELLLRKL